MIELGSAAGLDLLLADGVISGRAECLLFPP
jgi:hypothetical protein